MRAEIGQILHTDTHPHTHTTAAKLVVRMVEHSMPALEVVLVFITIYLHIFLIENCPKLRACIPNFGHTLICCYRPKLRFCRVTSDTKTCFKKNYINPSEQIQTILST